MATITKKKVALKKAVAIKAIAPKKDNYSVIFTPTLDSFYNYENDEIGEIDARNWIDEEDNSLIIDIKNNDKALASIHLDILPCNVTCGAFEVNFFSRFEAVINNATNKPKIKKIIKAAIVEFIGGLKEKGRYAYCIASNNDLSPEINSILQSLALATTGWRENPNSWNNIQIFII